MSFLGDWSKISCIIILVRSRGVGLYNCDVKWTSPQADGDKPNWDWPVAHDSVHDVIVNKKSNALLVFVLLATEV